MILLAPITVNQRYLNVDFLSPMMFRKHLPFNVADNIFFWRGVCEMYEQSYCLSFYVSCSFCFWCLPPKRATFYIIDYVIDDIVVLVVTLGLSFWPPVFLWNRVYLMLKLWWSIVFKTSFIGVNLTSVECLTYLVRHNLQRFFPSNGQRLSWMNDNLHCLWL